MFVQGAVDPLREAGTETGDHRRMSDRALLANLFSRPGKGQEPDQPAFDLAGRLLADAGGLGGLARLSVEELGMLPGVHPADARRLRAAMELGRRLAAPAPSTTRAIQSAVDVADWFRCQMQDLSRESLHALLLDGKNRPVKHLALAEGSWNSCPVDPKVVFSACLRHAAPALILVHNHPSGDPSPSRDDLELTERLLRAGQVIGIRVLDHLIVGREGYLSLADHGFM